MATILLYGKSGPKVSDFWTMAAVEVGGALASPADLSWPPVHGFAHATVLSKQTSQRLMGYDNPLWMD